MALLGFSRCDKVASGFACLPYEEMQAAAAKAKSAPSAGVADEEKKESAAEPNAGV